MAANCPIVCTNVGDVTYLLSGLEGAFVAETYEVAEVSSLVSQALVFQKIKGLKQLMRLQLDSVSVARKIVEVYKKAI